MNLVFACPHCDKTSAVLLTAVDKFFRCLHCRREIAVPEDALEEGKDGALVVHRCVVCPCREMYVRRNFSQRLGIMIIGAGIIASTITWSYHMIYATFGIFFASALLDVVLYLLVGNMLQCYRCHAEYRGISGLEDHVAFDLETHERFRQQSARLAESEDS